MTIRRSSRSVGTEQNRKKRRDARTREAQRKLLLERLEGRVMLNADPASVARPFPDGLDHPDPVVRDLIAQITTTGSDAALETYGDGDGISPSTVFSLPLINKPAFDAHPDFAGVDGGGFAVAILDTGIDLDHPFFGQDNNNDGVADRIVHHHDFLNNDNDASDDDGHGSNVSSIALSSDVVTPGVASGADIIHLKVLGPTGGTFGVLESALQWVVGNADTFNIASINMSLGDSSNSNIPVQKFGIDDELAALVAMDVIVVSAAGNDFFTHGSAPGVGYPAADPNSLAVSAVWTSDFGGPINFASGATDNTTGPDRITSFSQRHPNLTSIMAPGAFITGANESGGTNQQAGTSQAAPHIAGIAALAQQIAERELGRRLSQQEFSDLLNQTGVVINDGDDEDDNVTNTGADYRRVDLLALANAISNRGSGSPQRPPQLIGVNPNDGELFRPDTDPGPNPGIDNVLHVAPTDLTFRFGGDRGLDPSTLDGIRITRAGGDDAFGDADDEVILPGFIGLGESDRIVVARFSETLPDDLYKIEIFGFDDANQGIIGLRDAQGNFLKPSVEGADRETIFFELDLGAQISAIVPQPISRAQRIALTGNPTGGTFRLAFDDASTVPIPFNATAADVQLALEGLANITPGEDVIVEGNVGGPWHAVFHGRYAGLQAPVLVPDPGRLTGPGAPGVSVQQTSELDQARDQVIVYFNDDDLDPDSAEDPRFYQLLMTEETVRNTDDTVQTPDNVSYYPDLDKAVLTFSGLPMQSGTFRLRIGTDEALPSAPVRITPGDAASDFTNALGLGTLTTSQIVEASIDAQTFVLDFPGDNDEPGHRDTKDPPQDHFLSRADGTTGITTAFYNFPDVYGRDVFGNDLHNAITDAQKQRTREIFAIFSNYLGIQFVESDNRGMSIVTGEFLDGTSGPGGAAGVAGGGLNGQAIMDVQDFQNPANDRPFGSWFRVALHEVGHLLGLGHSYELPAVMGQFGLFSFGQGVEPDFPGNHDVVHGQFRFRPESKDIDLYQFTLNDTGVFTAETISERLPNSSLLDSHLRLYRENTDGSRELIAQNDDYFSEDSYIELDLGPGTYFIGVSASGNDAYDPNIIDSGIGGRTQGDYDLRLNFRPAADDSIVDTSGVALDGDLDGVPGGVSNFWFQSKPLERVVEVSGNGTTFTDGQRISITDGAGTSQIFEFNSSGGVSSGARSVDFNAGSTQEEIRDEFISEINASPFGVTARAHPTSNTRLILSGEQNVTLTSTPVGLHIEGRTLVVDKTATGDADGSLDAPFNNLSRTGVVNAFRNAHPGDIVRIVGNGGLDNDLSTAADTFAYEIGFGGPLNRTLADGSTMNVPRDVTVMIDAGAVFKLRQARIGVGSSTASVDRSGASIQVLGTPETEVFFTSFNDEGLGVDTNPIPTNPRAGDWGGISVKQDVDAGQGRFVWEREGIFLNYINHANMQFGGGNVFVDSVLQVINPIHLTRSRPTISFNTITNSADAAISADPNSFEETNFHAPPFQFSGAFTSDYDRVGPDIDSNTVVGNSNNGLFVRISTPAGGQLLPMTVSGRFDDTDITHILSQNLDVRGTPSGPVLDDNPPPSTLITFAPLAGGTLAAGVYEYRFSFVDINGNEGPASAATNLNSTLPSRTITGGPGQGSIRLRNVPPVTSGFVGRRIYRSHDGGPFELVAQIDGSAASFIDDGTTAGGTLTVASQLRLARPDARLAIDPGTIVKLEAARIEASFGAQLLAEGQDGREVIFTSRLDDRYGASGTFDTDNNGQSPTPTSLLQDGGDWGGIYIGHTSTASFDHALVTLAGGIIPLEGDFAGFNPIEVHQGRMRIRNSVVEMNDTGTGGSAPGHRFGRNGNAEAAIFVRAAQPVILDNVIRDNDAPAININVNSLSHELLKDYGRSRGEVDLVNQFFDNQGPLVRRNQLSNDPSASFLRRGVNGMLVRGETLDTQSVWDDTDITHVLRNTVFSTNFHSFGGVRLESSPSESLVVKLQGNGAGFTATGTPLDIDDRIGGVVQIVGQPGFPVIMTSLGDDSVGAGFQPNGLPQLDTNNNGFSIGTAGNWDRILLDRFSHDRNVEVALELEAPDGTAPGTNFTADTAQFLGGLARNEKSGDENLRLGFEIHGVINEPNDVDVYSFTGTAGSEVWIDVDRTTHALDTVVELIDGLGNIIAQSNDSDAETKLARAGDDVNAALFEAVPDTVQANILQKSSFFPRSVTGDPQDQWTTNPRDAGFRIVLPGTFGERATYAVRIRSSNVPQAGAAGTIAELQDDSKLFDGITTGTYQLQIRLRETDEFGGSTVRFADVRYATVGIELRGVPGHSPLLGETGEDRNEFNDDIGSAQPIGNLLASDRAAIGLSGDLSAAGDLDFYNLEVDYQLIQQIGGVTASNLYASTTFDIDYADGIGRPNTSLYVFDSSDRLILVSKDGARTTNPSSNSTVSNSNVADDLPGPLAGLDFTDLARGSGGNVDPYIGPVELPANNANYTVVVSSSAREPEELQQFRIPDPANPLARLEPVNSTLRIVEDHIGTTARSTAAAPATHPFLSTAQDVTFNLAEAVVPYTLNDVVLFVSNGFTMTAINPFTGVEINTLGPNGGSQPSYADFAMRPDGRMFGLSLAAGNGTQNDGTTGNYLEISPINGTVASRGDDGLTTWEDDPNSTNSPPDDRVQNVGLRYQAMAYKGDIDSLELFGISTRPDGIGVGAEGKSVLYELDPTNGSVIANNLPNRQNPNQNNGGGTAVIENGVINSAAPITGAAFVGTRMFGVDSLGFLYEINENTGGISATHAIPGLPNFTGLARGPLNAEAGAYGNILIGIDNTGTLHAFDTNGRPQNIFVDGQSTIATGVGGAVGLDFTVLDYNLWHVSNRRSSDAGHGINRDFQGSDVVNGGHRVGGVNGGSSFYFGFEDFADNEITSASRPANCGSNPEPICFTYDFPGGVRGTLESEPMSLVGYSPEDSPMLYFNYFLDTENRNSDLTDGIIMRDSFRVYGAAEDGVWHLLATNNGDRGPGNQDDEFDPAVAGDFNVVELYDIGENGAPDSWRQARINLAPFAGQDNIRIRFDFASAGSMGPRGTDANFPHLRGDELRGIDAIKLRDGQTFEISNPDRTFEFDLGTTIVAPTGANIDDGDQFTVNGFTYTFSNSTGSGRNILVNDLMSAENVASAIASEVNNDLFNFTRAVRVDERVQLRDAFTDLPTITASQSGLPAGFLEGTPGTSGVDVDVKIEWDSEAVAAAYESALESIYGGDFKRYDHVVRVIGRLVNDRGPLGLTQDPIGTRGLVGDRFGDPEASLPSETSEDNDHEGVYIDDIIVGFVERGEMVTGARDFAAGFNPVPLDPPVQTLVGEYQLEIRRSAEYGATTSSPPPQMSLNRSFDTNDRIVESITFTAPAGSAIHDAEQFTLSDGVNSMTFEFEDITLPLGDANQGVAPGHVSVAFHPVWDADRVAESIRDTINSNQVQAVLGVTAGLSDGVVTGTLSTSNKINLYGNVVADVFGETDFGIAIQRNGGSDHGNGGQFRGDQNRFRDQGQVLIHSNFISHSGQFGIVAGPGARDGNSAAPHQGTPRHLRKTNDERLFPAATIVNNVLDRNLSGGIHFSGDANPAGDPFSPAPFGRVVNNTVFGRNANDEGIRVDQNASVTVLNNIVSNVRTGINDLGNGTVIGANLFQNVQLGANLGFSPIDATGQQVFLNPNAGVFYLAANSPAIDTALDALNDRQTFVNVKSPAGIPASPILAPDRDVVGQLRADGDNTSGGQGANPFKDRGAFDRVDELGPSAQLLIPLDNDRDKNDTDPTETNVKLLEGTLTHFAVLIEDGEGTGPDPNTLSNLTVTVTEDRRGLIEGVDYVFGFNATNNTIRITPISRIWKPGSAYEITINNRDRIVLNAPHGGQVVEGDQFTLNDTSGGLTTFEFESGTTIFVPETLAIAVPSAGAVPPEGLLDGDGFTVEKVGFTPVTFEFDSNNNTNPDTVVIPFTNADSAVDLANKILAALTDPGQVELGLDPKIIPGTTTVHLGSQADNNVNLNNNSRLVLSGQAAGVADGDLLSINYNGTLVNFEFDANDSIAADNVQIPFAFSDTHNELADRIVATLAVQNARVDSALELSPVHLGDGKVHIGGQGYFVDTSQTGVAHLRQSGVGGMLLMHVPSSGVNDGESFTIGIGTGRPVRFEFDSDFSIGRNAIGIPFTAADTVADIVGTMIDVLAGTPGLGLDPIDLGGGQIELSQGVTHLISASQSNLTQAGTPGVMDSLTALMPAVGGAGVTDGSTFNIRLGQGTPVVFEFNNDGNTNPQNTIINFNTADTPDDLARAIVSVVGSAGAGLNPETVPGSGIVRWNETVNHEIQIDPMTGLLNVGVRGGSVPIPYIPDASFTSARMAGTIVNAINFSDANVQARLRGSETVFLDGVVLDDGQGGTGVIGNISHFVLRGTKDIAGNNLQPNRPNNETQFTVLLPGVELDFGDAPDPLGNVDGKYPTREASDGARHVIVPGSVALGGRVDADIDGQPTRSANGDDSDTTIDLSDTFMRSVGLPPFHLRVPSGGASAMADDDRFSLTDGVNTVTFSFDLDGTPLAGTTAVALTGAELADEVADDLVAAIQAELDSFNLQGFSPVHVGGGVIDLGGQPALNVSPGPLVPAGTATLQRFELLPLLELQVPAQGAADLSDGDTFTVRDGNVTVVFEFDMNGTGATSGDIAIPLSNESQDEVADLLVAEIQLFFPGLAPDHVGGTGGLVDLGANPDTSLDTAGSGMTQFGPVGDGDGLRINDGVHPTLQFEFDRNGVFNGDAVPIFFNDADSAAEIVETIARAVRSQLDQAKLVDLEPQHLGDGLLHLANRPRHAVDLINSALTFTQQLPQEVTTLAPSLAIQVPSVFHIQAPLTQIGGAGLADGDTFTINDGVNLAVTFEFDNGGGVAGLNRAIPFDGTETQSDINARVVAAIQDAVAEGDLGDVSAGIDGFGLLQVTGSANLSITATGNIVSQLPVEEGQFFTVSDGTLNQLFEFDRDGSVGGGRIAVAFQDDSTANDIAASIAGSLISSPLTGLAPDTLGDGIVQLGEDTPSHSFTPDTSGLASTGVAAGVADGQTFAIDDGVRTVTFEFDRNGDWDIDAGNIRVDIGNLIDDFSAARTDADVADAMVGTVNAAFGANVLARATMLGNVITLSADDEDGVRFLDVINPNVVTEVEVIATGSGLLDAWIDHNQDGDWDDFGEKVLDSVTIERGRNVVDITTPATALAGETFARFRISAGGGLFPQGITLGGEVEDHRVVITKDTPPVVANDNYGTTEDDVLTVAATGILANDTDTENDATAVFEVNGQTANVGRTIQLRVEDPDTGLDVDSGVVTVQADGSFVYDPTVSDFLQTLPQGETILERFTYRSHDEPNCTFAADPSCGRGISNNTATVSITVTGVNDAPELIPADPVINVSVHEDMDASNTPVFDVASFTLGSIFDIDDDAVEGIAVTAANGNGTWQYSIDGGATFADITGVADTAALLLRSSDLVRYLPDMENGEDATLEYVAWDQIFDNPGDLVDLSDPASTGGTTSYSDLATKDTATLTVASRNDAPVLAAGTDNLGTTDEDTPLPGVVISSFLAGNVGDVDLPADLLGIAIVQSGGNGNWEYSADGATGWTPVGSVTDTSALLLPDTYSVRYAPDQMNGEASPTLVYRAWDRTSGMAESLADTSTNGGTTAYSVDVRSAAVTVTSVNDAPTVVSGTTQISTTPPVDEDMDAGTSPSINIGNAIAGTLADVDIPADLLGIAVVGATGNGNWTYSVDGGTTFVPLPATDLDAALLLRGNDQLKYLPDGLNGETATISYLGWDQTSGTFGTQVDLSGAGATGGTTAFSDIAGGQVTAELAVASVNDFPFAQNDVAATDEDTSIDVDVLANDSDVDIGDSISIKSFDGRSGMGADISLSGGQLHYDPMNARLIQQLREGAPATDTFQYTIEDLDGATATAIVTINLTGVDDPPRAVDDPDPLLGNQAKFRTTEKLVLDIDDDDLLANDIDDDGDTNRVASVSGDTNTRGAVSFDGSVIQYDPNGAFVSLAVGDVTTDVFQYTIADQNDVVSPPANVTITIDGVNDPPTPADDEATTDANQLLSVPARGLLLNDTDPDQGETGLLRTVPETVTSFPGGATVIIADDGSYLYDPRQADALRQLRPGQPATDFFLYQIEDTHGAAGTRLGTVSVQVIGVNDPPEATDDVLTTDENTPLTGDIPGLLENDADIDRDPIEVASADATSAFGAQVVVNSDGSFTYDPTGVAAFQSLTTNETRTDTFRYTIQDLPLNASGPESTATVTVTVTGINDPPDVVDDSYVNTLVSEDSVLSISVSASVLNNDSDQELNSFEAVTIVNGLSAAGATVNLNADGSFTYDPTTSETLQRLPTDATMDDTFTYQARELGDPTNVSLPATVTLRVTGVNDAPEPVDDDDDNPTSQGLLNVSEDGPPLSIAQNTLTGNDVDDNGDTLSVVGIDTTNTKGLATLFLSVLGNTVTYSPNSQFESLAPGETDTDVFTYTVEDQDGLQGTAEVTITITGVNDAPIANPDSFTTGEDDVFEAAGVGVLFNDSDPEGDTITTVAETRTSTLGATVTINSDGTFRYDPTGVDVIQRMRPNDSRTDSFAYIVTDGSAQSTGSVNIVVTGANDSPQIGPDMYRVDEDSVLTVFPTEGVLANDVDPEGDPLTATLVRDAANGTVSLAVDGSFLYTPDPDFAGTDTFTYEASDGQGGISIGTVTIEVTNVNDPPVALGDAYTVDQDTDLVVDAANGLLANDGDIDREPLVAQRLTNPSRGTVTVNADGSFVYTPQPGFFGKDSFTYRAVDSGGASSTATVQITIKNTQIGRNPLNPLDVNADGEVTPRDALLVINDVNSRGVGAPAQQGPPFTDVTGNGSVDAADVLRGVKHLNQEVFGSSEGEASPAVATPDNPADPAEPLAGTLLVDSSPAASPAEPSRASNDIDLLLAQSGQPRNGQQPSFLVPTRPERHQDPLDGLAEDDLLDTLASDVSEAGASDDHDLLFGRVSR